MEFVYFILDFGAILLSLIPMAASVLVSFSVFEKNERNERNESRSTVGMGGCFFLFLVGVFLLGTLRGLIAGSLHILFPIALAVSIVVTAICFFVWNRMY